MIEGVKNNIDTEILLKRADPLGEFEQLKNIRMVDGEDYGSLYETVLIDLPIGRYFRQLLANEDASRSDQIAEAMKDYKPEKIKNMLKKIWLRELHTFVNEHLNATSKPILNDLIMFESDCMTIQVILNTLGSKAMTGPNKVTERERYINNIGYLVPDRIKQLIEADSLQKVKEAVSPFGDYAAMLEPIQDLRDGDEGGDLDAGGPSIDEIMAKAKSKRWSMAFEDQFHFGVFFAYLRLKEQEIKNVVWLAELVSLNVDKSKLKYDSVVVVPFKYHKDDLGPQ